MFKSMKVKALAVISAVSASIFATTANAALVAADLTALGTEVDGDLTLVKGAVLPIIFTVVALLVGIKLLKKLTAKI